MGKENVTYILVEYHTTIKNSKILPTVTIWMDLEGSMLSKISQTEKGQIPYNLTSMWNLDNQPTKLTETENRLVIVRGGGGDQLMGSKGTNLSYKRSHGNITYNMVTTVNNTVLYI